MKVSAQKALLVSSLLCFAALAGCSSSDMSVKGMGNSILKTVGLLPGDSVMDATQGLIKATQDLSREEEYYLGRAVSARILTMYPVVSNEPLVLYVNKVGLSVAHSSDQPETFGGYHFELLNTAETNALSAPGGFIFITKGMLELASDEDILAATLAHEVGHVVAQHGVKAISQANLNKALTALGKLAGSLNCGEVLQQATVVFGAAVDDVAQTLLNKGYSRDQELEADEIAVQILARSGYDPHALSDMLALLAQRSAESKQGGWFKSHPGLEERQAALARYLERHELIAGGEGKSKRQARYQAIAHS